MKTFFGKNVPHFSVQNVKYLRCPLMPAEVTIYIQTTIKKLNFRHGFHIGGFWCLDFSNFTSKIPTLIQNFSKFSIQSYKTKVDTLLDLLQTISSQVFMQFRDLGFFNPQTCVKCMMQFESKNSDLFVSAIALCYILLKENEMKRFSNGKCKLHQVRLSFAAIATFFCTTNLQRKGGSKIAFFLN